MATVTFTQKYTIEVPDDSDVTFKDVFELSRQAAQHFAATTLGAPRPIQQMVVTVTSTDDGVVTVFPKIGSGSQRYQWRRVASGAVVVS